MDHDCDDDKPSSAVEAFVTCNQDLYPNLSMLLRILATLPVSTATAERSFSTLKKIKSYIRNSTSESRLNGLALLSVHREIVVDPQEVLRRFGLAPNIKIWLSDFHRLPDHLGDSHKL